jgi:hypothetical protein
MTVTPASADTDTSFITFDSSTRVVSWQTSSPAQVGTYTITITATITTTD